MGMSTAAAGIAGGGAGRDGGGTGAAVCVGAGGGAAAPVMLGARTNGADVIGPGPIGADVIGQGAGSTVGGLVPAVAGGGQSCIGAHAPSQTGPSQTGMAMMAGAIIAAGRRPDFPPRESALSAMVGILDPRRCSPGDYNLPAAYETGREARLS